MCTRFAGAPWQMCGPLPDFPEGYYVLRSGKFVYYMGGVAGMAVVDTHNEFPHGSPKLCAVWPIRSLLYADYTFPGCVPDAWVRFLNRVLMQ